MRGRVSFTLALTLAFVPAAGRTQVTQAAQADSIHAAVDWIATSCTGPSGTFRVHPGWRYVSGYFGNIIGVGLIAAQARPDLVRDWMAYYVDHAHGSATGVDGVPDDVNILADGSLQSRGTADSTDAYGATFMMLARAAYESGNPMLRAFVMTHKAAILRIGESSLVTQQPNGLTWSKPQHHVVYALDNMQVYRGMLDGAALAREAYGDGATAARWRAAANLTEQGIRTYVWEDATTSYRWFVNAHFVGPTSDLSVAYPGSVAQDMAMIYDLPDLTPQKTASLLSRTFASMSSPLANARREYRIIYDLAHARTGVHVDPPPFTPSDVCADAGWYLQLAAIH